MAKYRHFAFICVFTAGFIYKFLLPQIGFDTFIDPKIKFAHLESQAHLHKQMQSYKNLNPENLTCSHWSRSVFDDIRKFVFFFGFNRCGSTATGFMIDAHPNALIANEYLLFDELSVNGKSVFDVSRRICSISFNWRRGLQSPKGYNLRMGAFHGHFKNPLQVIGNRCSYRTLAFFNGREKEFDRAYAA